MTIFSTAIADIFNAKDFLETCMVDGTVYKCICSAITDETVYTEVGSVDDCSFTLSIKLTDIGKMPKQGSKVVFRDEKYKVSNVEVDSANTSIILHLQSTSKG